MSDRLNNYFMRPKYVEYVGLVYPLSIHEYEEFRLLFSIYLLFDIDSINNKNKQDGLPISEYDNLFDYLTDKIIKDKYTLNNKGTIMESVMSMFGNFSEEKLNAILESNPQLIQECINKESYERFVLDSENNICSTLSLTVKNKVKFDDTNKVFIIVDENEEIIGVIHRDNFNEYRKAVMEQNLLFEPLISPDKDSQEKIDRDIKRRNGDEEFDLEAVVAFVSINSSKDISDYTYYRLMADYMTILRSKSYDSTSIYRASGCKDKNNNDIDYPNLTEHLTIKDNPYSREKLYKESMITDFDKGLINK